MNSDVVRPLSRQTQKTDDYLIGVFYAEPGFSVKSSQARTSMELVHGVVVDVSDSLVVDGAALLLRRDSQHICLREQHWISTNAHIEATNRESHC